MQKKRHWKHQKELNSSQIIALGFAGVIFVGALLLYLPVSAAPGKETAFVDALFTATTSVCVTGLTTVITAEQWSRFGQGVVLLLIQLGGIGVVAMTTMIFVGMRRRIGMRSRKLIQESYNLDSMSGMVKSVRRVIFCIFGAEAIGACLYSLRFVPLYGVGEGIWQSVFTAVSAFCNAGLDVLGSDSLAPFRGDVLVNLTTMGLIIMSGLGFIVWWDLWGAFRALGKREIRMGQFWQKLRLHSKVVLFGTGVLIFAGAGLFFLLERKNPGTLGGEPVGVQVLASFFQSVTTRTAGFFTIDQGQLTEASAAVTLLWMFIGGSPMGTAGGVKTTTMVLLIFTVASYVKGKKDTELFGRRVKESLVRSALAVVLIGFATLFVGCVVLSVLEPEKNLLDIAFELTSAVATVGLTRGITMDLSSAGKLVVILIMYLGRIGPVTMVSAIVRRTEGRKEGIRLAEGGLLL